MKANLYIKILLCCSLLLPGACSDDDDKPKKSTNISVVSFNIRVDNPVDGDNVWENRKAAAAAMIEYEQPTLLGLQEAQPHQITYLAKNCPDYAWYGLGRDTGECPPETDTYAAEECMVIFYRTSEVELLEKGTFWLSTMPNVPSKGWDAGYNRSCTWGLFKHKSSGRNFYFFNTHLDNSGTMARKFSLQLIAEKAREFNPEAHPMFLTADFNSDTDETIFAPLFKVMHDARRLATVTDDRATFNGYKETATRKLDYFLLKLPGLSVQNTDPGLRRPLHFGPLSDKGTFRDTPDRIISSIHETQRLYASDPATERLFDGIRRTGARQSGL